MNGIPLLGASTRALEIGHVDLADEGVYTVVVTDALGSTTSLPAILRVRNNIPEGEIRFRNFGPALDAPIFDAYGARLGGPAFLAQLYGGATADALVPIGAAVPFGRVTRRAFLTAAPARSLEFPRALPGISVFARGKRRRGRPMNKQSRTAARPEARLFSR